MKAQFRGPLRFEDQNARAGGVTIRLLLLEPLVYDSAILHRTITVPPGFVTDLASVPQILWNILPPMGAYDEAAVVHDFLYQLAPQPLTRHQADQVLNEAMEVLRVQTWRRLAIYAGVCVGGWRAWNRYRAGQVHA